MSTIWHPCTEPPDPLKEVRLRFSADGAADGTGRYSRAFGGYYRSMAAMHRHEPVHPTHWAEINHVDNRE